MFKPPPAEKPAPDAANPAACFVSVCFRFRRAQDFDPRKTDRALKMVYLLRHLLSILALPVMVMVVLPISIAANKDIGFTMPSDIGGTLAVVIGSVFGVIGAALFAASNFRFATEGNGTLAPWDPPRNLVITGPYRYVRNPMLSGVSFVLFAEALILRSGPHLQWAVFFGFMLLVFVPWTEEHQLEARFGEDYLRYKANVPRLFPRLRPWQPNSETSAREPSDP